MARLIHVDKTIAIFLSLPFTFTMFICVCHCSSIIDYPYYGSMTKNGIDNWTVKQFLHSKPPFDFDKSIDWSHYLVKLPVQKTWCGWRLRANWQTGVVVWWWQLTEQFDGRKFKLLRGVEHQWRGGSKEGGNRGGGVEVTSLLWICTVFGRTTLIIPRRLKSRYPDKIKG